MVISSVFPFCPFCCNFLFAQQVGDEIRFACRLCPVSFPIKGEIVERTFCQLKEVGDVRGGSEDWANCDKTAETCPECSHPHAYFLQVQTRSADEPMTIFYRCCNPTCAHNWSL